MSTTHAAAETAAADEPQAVPFDLAAAAAQAAARAADESADLTGAAEVERVVAGQAREHAGHARAEAEALVAAAEAEARRVVAAARAAGRALAESAALADKLAGFLEDRGRLIGQVTAAQERMLAAMALAAELEAERAGLGEQIEVADHRIAALEAERAAADGRLTAALEAADAPLIAEARSLRAAQDDARAVLTGQRGRLRARFAAIGPAEGPGEHGDARTAAARHLRAADRARNELYPDTPAARMAAATARFVATFEANSERIANEQRAKEAAARPQPRDYVNLTTGQIY